jgi:hypothetical protein
MQFKTVAPGGVLTMTVPSPLSVEDLIVTLRQLAVHPEYDHFHVMAISHDDKLVKMRDGECEVMAFND